MESNKKILKVGIILIIATLVISLGSAFYLHLDEPVFLKSYMEIDLPINDVGNFGDTGFEVRYITNSNDNRVVNHIEFDEAPGLYSSATEYNNPFDFGFFADQNNKIPGDIVGRYSIRTIFIKVDANQIENISEEIRLTKAKVHFANGDIMETDIGDIVLYGYNKTGEHFEGSYGKSSSDGSGRTQSKVKEDITLLKIESPLLEQAKEFIEFKIGNVDYNDISGINYLAGDSLVVDYMFREPDDTMLKFYTYNIHPKLIYKDNEGNIFSYRFYNVDYKYHGFEFMEIVEFLRSRGEI